VQKDDDEAPISHPSKREGVRWSMHVPHACAGHCFAELCSPRIKAPGVRLARFEPFHWVPGFSMGYHVHQLRQSVGEGQHR
jgi:hypothetical protein